MKEIAEELELPAVLTFDWKASPTEVLFCVAECLDGLRLAPHIDFVETDGDDIVVVLSEERLFDAELKAVYEKYVAELDEIILTEEALDMAEDAANVEVRDLLGLPPVENIDGARAEDIQAALPGHPNEANVRAIYARLGTEPGF